MKIYLRKTLGGKLEPADDEAEEELKKIKSGRAVSCEIKRPRHIGHHRKYFAMLNIVLNNQESFKTTAQLLDAIKMDVGHVDMFKDIKGNVFYKPASISFSSMTQDKFEKFYSLSIDCILANLMVGTTTTEIEEAVNEVIGFS